MGIQEVYQKAIDFAAKAHNNQKVPGKEYSYIVHPTNVAMEVIIALQHEKVEHPELAIQCALLHDTLEDTSVTENELTATFGRDVAQGVLALSKNKDLPKAQQMISSLVAIEKYPREIGLVKLADRITNLQQPPDSWTNEKRIAYAREARVILAALKHYHGYLGKRLEEKIAEYEKKYISS